MKFISSTYDKDTKISTVIMQHLGRKFEGKATAHPEEINPSEYAGCKYAEIRATIKALKYERKLLKNKADIAHDFLKACKCYKNFDDQSKDCKIMYKQLNKRIDRVNKITEDINNLYEELESSFHRREVVIRAINRKKKLGQSKVDNI